MKEPWVVYIRVRQNLTYEQFVANRAAGKYPVRMAAAAKIPPQQEQLPEKPAAVANRKLWK